MARLAALDYERAESEGVTAKQLESIEYAWAAIARYFGADASPDVITYDNVEQYLQHRTRVEGVGGQTSRKERQALRRMAELAHRRGWLLALPQVWPRVRNSPPKRSQAGKLHPLEIINVWLGELPGEARDEAALALRLGLRSEELRRAQVGWREETQAGDFVHVPPEGSKTRDERWIGLTGEALEIWDRLSRNKVSADNLLSGKAHRSARRLAARRIGYDEVITLRDLRATFASLGLHGSGDAQATQSSLGHSDLRTTQRYQHTTLERNARVAEVVSDALSATPQPPQSRKMARIGRGDTIRTCDPLLPKRLREASEHVLACKSCATTVIERMRGGVCDPKTATHPCHTREVG